MEHSIVRNWLAKRFKRSLGKQTSKYKIVSFHRKIWKILEVTKNGGDIQFSAEISKSWHRNWDSWNSQVIRNSQNHTDYNSAVLLQQEWHKLPQNAVTTFLSPNKLNSRTIVTGISDHYPILKEELPCTKQTETKSLKNWIRQLEKRDVDIADTKFLFKLNHIFSKLPTNDLNSNIKNCLNMECNVVIV